MKMPCNTFIISITIWSTHTFKDLVGNSIEVCIRSLELTRSAQAPQMSVKTNSKTPLQMIMKHKLETIDPIRSIKITTTFMK